MIEQWKFGISLGHDVVNYALFLANLNMLGNILNKE